MGKQGYQGKSGRMHQTGLKTRLVAVLMSFFFHCSTLIDSRFEHTSRCEAYCSRKFRAARATEITNEDDSTYDICDN